MFKIAFFDIAPIVFPSGISPEPSGTIPVPLLPTSSTSSP